MLDVGREVQLRAMWVEGPKEFRLKVMKSFAEIQLIREDIDFEWILKSLNCLETRLQKVTMLLMPTRPYDRQASSAASRSSFSEKKMQLLPQWVG